MNWLIDNIKNFGQSKFLSDGSVTYSYTELLNAINLYLDLIEKNKLETGEVVVISSDYSFHSISLLMALAINGNIIVPLVTKNSAEFEEKVRISGATKIIKLENTTVSFIDTTNFDEENSIIADLKKLNDAGLVLFSSGSTGEPKAMVHNFTKLVNSFQDKKKKSLNMMLFLMFDHVGGVNTLLNCLSMGAHIILPQDRNPINVAGLIEKYSVQVLPTTPTFLNMMLMSQVNKQFSLGSLRMITYGTEPMPESLLEKLKVAFPKVRLMQTFGTSETGIANTSSRSSNSLDIRFDDPNTEVKIVEGELWLRSKTQVLGYLNSDMSSFTDDGWFKTGDLVEDLGDNYFKIVGRAKEVINVGGEKVLPAEVESVVMEIEFVEDCLAYPMKNMITGQAVGLQVVIANNINDSEAELRKVIRKYCSSRMERYKTPTKIEFVTKTNFGDRFKKLRLKIQ
ncbi:ANL family adenylate-forming protein [Vibrio fluvialis]|uniref:ANL family adenylate-forming protein n=1 Tax=Vibrio fluvialis TaxID=676 RepID=UPI001EEA4F33|nr:fatty acid--CoA ligase family protein [Vibrio fluvialis]MCG6349094.1 fatty acid--CoA ligase family protein [Vibrio fluvialis]